MREMDGARFGRLVVVQFDRIHNKRRRWLCRCDCGAEKSIDGASLRSGNTKSCGCATREASSRRATDRNLKHGARTSANPTVEYAAWQAMLQRCTRANHPAFANYGGRGISVCALWRESFENFLADMGPRPANRSLDRIDNDGDYKPGNCRWATYSEQMKNRRSARRAEGGRFA